MERLRKDLTMPIRIPDALPATSILEGENIFVMTEHRAIHRTYVRFAFSS